MKKSWAYSQDRQHLTAGFMQLTSIFFKVDIPSALWNVLLATSLLNKPIQLHSHYRCMCVWLENETALTWHISLIKLQSMLLSLYASQASVCSRSNSSFVTLKLMWRGWNFIHQTHGALFKQHGSQLPGNALLKFISDMNSVFCLYHK